jgi:hypothetical protein
MGVIRKHNYDILTRKCVCPVCGKEYFPAPLHSYHAEENKYGPLVCSYSCSRKNVSDKPKRRTATVINK